MVLDTTNHYRMIYLIYNPPPPHTHTHTHTPDTLLIDSFQLFSRSARMCWNKELSKHKYMKRIIMLTLPPRQWACIKNPILLRSAFTWLRFMCCTGTATFYWSTARQFSTVFRMQLDWRSLIMDIKSDETLVLLVEYLGRYIIARQGSPILPPRPTSCQYWSIFFGAPVNDVSDVWDL